MFGKSMKYEFKAVARKIVPLFITVLVISVLLGVTFIVDGRVIPSAPEAENPYAAERIIDLMQWILVAGLIIMIFVVSIAVFVLMIKRFYSSFFTDEGYLTFTLPVSVDCHLMTKIVSMLIWSFFGSIVTALSYLIIGGGIEIGYGVISDIADQAREVLSELGEILSLIWKEYTGSVVLSFFYSALYIIIEILLLYFGISLGCMLSKKHRVITSIVCIVGISIVFSFVDAVVSEIASVASDPFILLVSLVILALVKLILLYLGTKTILVKKLNLD